MNELSASKCREMDSGLLGEKSFEIVIATPRSEKVRCALEMYHLTLNKQASYLGQRNLKYFDGCVSILSGSSCNNNATSTGSQSNSNSLNSIQSSSNNSTWQRRVTARVMPYSPMISGLEVSQKHTDVAQGKSAEVSVSVSNSNESEMRRMNKSHVSFAIKFKQPFLRNSLTLFTDDTLQRYGLNYRVSFSNKHKKKHVHESGRNLSNETSAENHSNNEDQSNLKAAKKSQLLFGISVNVKQIRFDRLPQCNVYADLMLQKFEGVLSANFTGKSVESIMGLFRYNSSLWMRITSATTSSSSSGSGNSNNGNMNSMNMNGGGMNNNNINGGGSGNANNNYVHSGANSIRGKNPYGGGSSSSISSHGGIELVYQHTFNEFIKLKNYINSSYTIATQLSYAPTDFITLIYSAQVNLQKFKQDIEDYKVGYGIHINL